RHRQDVDLRALVVQHPEGHVEVGVGALEAVDAAAHGLVGVLVLQPPGQVAAAARPSAITGTFCPLASKACTIPAIMPPSWRTPASGCGCEAMYWETTVLAVPSSQLP